MIADCKLNVTSPEQFDILFDLLKNFLAKIFALQQNSFRLGGLKLRFGAKANESFLSGGQNGGKSREQ
ncbi:MAG: hypothetical protein AMJ65_02530 [Phycisphaerae bacterium SG8_4]|nr:MAG: hypothetical protein AMJ65_02530 [Phycisphaerae bacterium SG8_4]